MKNIKIVIVYAFVSFTGLFITSCNYLDVESYFTDTLDYDSIFINYDNLSKYMWAAADYFEKEGEIYSRHPGPLACEEGFVSFADKDGYPGIKYVLGEIDESNISSFGMNIWPQMYKAIRKCNIILSRKHEAGLTYVQDQEITGYTLMIRAYAYYLLIQNYGPVILLGDDIYPTNEDADVYNNYRSTYDECVDYVCEQLEEAARYLSLTVATSYFGRPSAAAAYALIARMRLTQASPLYNGGQAARTAFGTWKRTIDGADYVSLTYDETRWAVAAAACKRVIDLDLFKLHTISENPVKPAKELPANVSAENFPLGAGDIDPFRSYSEMFTGESPASKNPEFIWANISKQLNDYTKHAFPVQDIMGGYNAMGINARVVEQYYMADGRDIKNSSEEYPYMGSDNYDDSETYFTINSETFSGYKLPAGVHRMYTNREMRFYASVGFSGRNWPASTCTQSPFYDRNAFYHEGVTEGSYAGGNLYSGKYASSRVSVDYPSTGYVITKWIHPDDAWNGSGAARPYSKPMPIIRYAEILLAYVEAMNNLTTSYTIELPAASGTQATTNSYTVSRNTDEMAYYFNQVRYRAGLPGLTTAELSSPEEMQSILEREYLIEFLFENKRFYDVRRWGTYESTENAGIYGRRLGEDVLNYYKSAIPVNQANNRNRQVDKKMILLPLPKAEVRRVQDLDQNPGWGS